MKILWCQAVIEESRIVGGFFKQREKKCLAPVVLEDRCERHKPVRVWP